MIFRTVWSAFLGLSLIGCGGGDEASVTQDPFGPTQINVLGNQTVDVDDQYTVYGSVSYDGGTSKVSSLASDTVIFSGSPSITRYRDQVDTVRAQNDYTFAFVSASDNSAAPSIGAVIGRATETQIPTTGTARYTGGYKSISYRNQDMPMQTVPTVLTGNLSMDVSFDESSINGSITSIEIFQKSGTKIGNLFDSNVLEPTSINADGTYSGTALQTASGITGTYEGIIGGPNGVATAGIVLIDDGGIQRIGAFIGEQ